jgi:hypothetical protein
MSTAAGGPVRPALHNLSFGSVVTLKSDIKSMY